MSCAGQISAFVRAAANLLAGWQGEEPQRLVSLILSESRSHGGLRDDCSVLCLYLPPSGRQV